MDEHDIATKKICVYGIVQGVGFRPFISRAAEKSKIKGSVCNKGSYVEIIAQGDEKAFEIFGYILRNEAPERSTVLKIDETVLPDAEKFNDFKIIESSREKGAIFVSPDIAICPKCKDELYNPKDRRYLHPFINCTACGPRLTILDSMPYDRERTSMGDFPMCEECNYEYTHPETRRYDAQPVCCNDCGPEVYILDGEKRGRDAIIETRRIISTGGIAAIKGIGGFHLCCDATDDEAVKRLRKLKMRPSKPFAVMARNMEAAERECIVPENLKEVLDGHQKPIILLERREGGKAAQSVAPDNPKLGLMLPYAPIQLLLFDYDDDIIMPDLLVMTSANASGAPICRDDEDARKELTDICDVIMTNNRLIRLRADDTVTDFYKDKPYMVRRSRGYAPLPVNLSKGWTGQVLGIGGELKNTFCIGRDELFYLSPYIGDMSDVRTVKVLQESVRRMETLLETEPEMICCDLHPGYNTSLIAEELSRERDIPLIKLQHHYAHILSCMAENDFDGEVIGVSFDGTGYGSDGTVWGGEILIASYKDFKRLGSIDPFKQVGGDIAAREGWRIAASMLNQTESDVETAWKIADKTELCEEKDLKLIHAMADKGLNAVTSTSAGRLFDAVSAVLGIRRSSAFESEASIALQFAAESYMKREALNDLDVINKKLELSAFESEMMDIENKYFYDNENDAVFRMGTMKLFKQILNEKLSGKNSDELAFYFHEKLAWIIAAGCDKARKQSGINTVALSGGVFQNKLLLTVCDNLLEMYGFKVLRHSMIPPNDGGLALGQAAAAMYRLNNK